MGLVVVAGAGTMLVAMLLVAHPAFHAHMDQIKPPLSTQAQTHVDEAFATGVLTASAVGVTVALAAALVVTWLVARRVAAPVTDAAEAAQQIADGDDETRLPQPRLRPEFDALTTSFNTMASRLATTEQTRRRLLTDLAHELRTPSRPSRRRSRRWLTAYCPSTRAPWRRSPSSRNDCIGWSETFLLYRGPRSAS